MARSAISLRIEGRVQGVGYRWWASSLAQRLGVEGWVRNRMDGSVELLALGPDKALEALAKACWQGPSAARVTTVVRRAAQDDGSAGFEQKATV